jgi:adenosine deaminase
VSYESIQEGLSAAARYAARQLNLEVRWVIDFPRVLGPEVGRQALEMAVRGKKWGVVAFDIAGYEDQAPDNAEFRSLFRQAKEAGLRLTVHAGETGPPSHVRTAVEEWGVDRIGHGIQAIHDPGVVSLLAERKIPLEISLTSNLCLGVVRRLEEHPLEPFRLAGVPVTLCTDDPTLFGITLSQEILAASTTFGWSRAVVKDIIETGWRYRFAG